MPVPLLLLSTETSISIHMIAALQALWAKPGSCRCRDRQTKQAMCESPSQALISGRKSLDLVTEHTASPSVLTRGHAAG
jgi:hypothetical protein